MPYQPVRPTSTTLCGTFADPTTRDPGRAFSAPVRLSCEAPTDEIAEDVEVVFVNGEPIFAEASAVDTGTGLSYAEFNYIGTVTDEEIFGGFRAPAACRVLGVQVAAQTAPAGADIEGVLVDANDDEIVDTEWTLGANETFENTTFGTALTLVAGDIIKAKIKQTGTTEEGGYLNVRLVIGPAT